MSAAATTPLGQLAHWLGAAEGGVRLMLSLLAGFPLSLLYRRFIYGRSAMYQHLYFILTGLAIIYFNFGTGCLHTLISILTIYVMLQVIGGTLISVILTFVFNLSYLMIGYIYTSTESYDINWTTPQCVLALRLIGLTLDVYDGKKKESELSSEQKTSALRSESPPALLEVASYTLFYGGCLIGPQFSLRRYRDFISGRFNVDSEGVVRPTPPHSVEASVKYLITGILYIALHLVISPMFPSTYLITDSFSRVPYYEKCLTLALWCRGELYKYIGCWLIAECSCALCGLSYNGVEAESGGRRPRWDGCCNVKLVRFESNYTFQHIIDSFNLNTNRWVATYVYKRLRFLGNKLYSQVVTLLFLALWHGYATGYYACFFMEFITMKWDREFVPTLHRSPLLSRWSRDAHPVVGGAVTVLRWLFLQVMMGFCLTPFVQLTTWKWIKVWQSMNYVGLIVFCLWPVVSPALVWLLTPTSPTPATKRESAGDEQKQK